MHNIKTIWGDFIPVSLRYSGSFRHRAEFCSGCQRGKYTQPSKSIKLYSFDNLPMVVGIVTVQDV